MTMEEMFPLDLDNAHTAVCVGLRGDSLHL